MKTQIGVFVGLAAASLLLGAVRVPAAESGSDDTTIVALRFVERIVVTLSGVLLLLFGYRLFDKNAGAGDLTAEVHERMKLRLQRVGPGVFFALFGTVILVYVMAWTVDVTT